MNLLIVGFGPVAGYKYSRCIHSAIKRGYLEGFDIVDRESQRENVEARLLKLPIKPRTCTFIPESVLADGAEAGIAWLTHKGILTEAETSQKVVIATEPQSHEAYIRQALLAKVDVLVTKPLVLPMVGGLIDRPSLMPLTRSLVASSISVGGHSALLCLGRLHEIYERRLRQPLALMVDRLQNPITSIHLKTASGVWNLPAEYGYREDHPYKYGYGMLMHGAYHYVDIVSRLILMNRSIYPNEDFELYLSGFHAGPLDQNARITHYLNNSLTGYTHDMSKFDESFQYGETDIVISFALKIRSTGRTLSLGTISLEQTTPGMRSWGPFPSIPYNVNGRLHSTDVDVRIGPAFGISANVTKHPIGARLGETDIRGVNSALITTRSNPRLTRTQGFIRKESFERPYGNSYSYSAEAEIFERWLLGESTYSDFASHLSSCALLDGLLQLTESGGAEIIKVDFNFGEPVWPSLAAGDDPWYAHMEDKVSFSSEV